MTENTDTRTTAVRYIVLAVVVVGAFLGAYQFAQARTSGGAAGGAQGAVAAVTPGTAPAGASTSDPLGGAGAGCSCCGSSAPTADGVTGDKLEGTAEQADGVQSISVDLSQGYYQPNVIKLAAGVPAQITFGQGSGCTAQVMSKDLGFFEDLTAGPVTVKLPALDAGEYSFACGMEMVFGKIVVE